MIYITHIESDLSKGYTQAALNYIKALQTQNVNFEVFPIASMINWGEKPDWIQSSKEYFAKTMGDRELGLIHMSPSDLLRVNIRGTKKSVGLTTFETTSLPSWIVEGLNDQYEGLIVPSHFNREALVNSGISIPVKVVEHAIGDWWQRIPEHRIENKPFVFGYLGGWNDRKNPEGILDAFLEAYPEPQENIALFLKTYASAGLDVYIQQKIKGREDIWYYNELWSEEQVAWGYSLMNVFVSAHRGEGFGLNIAQAAAIGKPVIYTDYSAPTEWLDATYNFPIDMQIEEAKNIDANKYLYFKGSSQKLRWAEPNHDTLVNLLRTTPDIVGENPSSLLQRLKLGNLFSWSSVGAKMTDALEDIFQQDLGRIE